MFTLYIRVVCLELLLNKTVSTFNLEMVTPYMCVCLLLQPKNWSYVMLGTILRAALAPLFLFCNSMPRQHTPVLFGDDAYIFLIIIFGFSEGVLINLSFLAVPT